MYSEINMLVSFLYYCRTLIQMYNILYCDGWSTGMGYLWLLRLLYNPARYIVTLRFKKEVTAVIQWWYGVSSLHNLAWQANTLLQKSPLRVQRLKFRKTQ